MAKTQKQYKLKIGNEYFFFTQDELLDMYEQLTDILIKD